ncbi:hypothetical protein BC826DRAFT_1034577 [Russula brevipes]|nr:hypothetical protein BC826DRAFT_1034577 [Russula brevipes]
MPSNRPHIEVRRQHQHELLQLAPQRAKQRHRAQAIIQRARNAQHHPLQWAAGREHRGEAGAGVERGERGHGCRWHLAGVGGHADEVGQREMRDVRVRGEEAVEERIGERVREQGEAHERRQCQSEDIRVERGEHERCDLCATRQALDRGTCRAGPDERGCQPDEHEWPHAHWRGPGRFLAGRARPIAGRPLTQMTNA